MSRKFLLTKFKFYSNFFFFATNCWTQKYHAINTTLGKNILFIINTVLWLAYRANMNLKQTLILIFIYNLLGILKYKKHKLWFVSWLFGIFSLAKLFLFLELFVEVPWDDINYYLMNFKWIDFFFNFWSNFVEVPYD